MNNLIIVPMQARIYNVIVNDIPSSLCNHKLSTQLITFPDIKKFIPIDFNGLIPYIKVRFPNEKDMECYQRTDLTYNGEWDAYVLDFLNNEDHPKTPVILVHLMQKQ